MRFDIYEVENDEGGRHLGLRHEDAPISALTKPGRAHRQVPLHGTDVRATDRHGRRAAPGTGAAAAQLAEGVEL